MGVFPFAFFGMWRPLPRATNSGPLLNNTTSHEYSQTKKRNNYCRSIFFWSPGWAAPPSLNFSEISREHEEEEEEEEEEEGHGPVDILLLREQTWDMRKKIQDVRE